VRAAFVSFALLFFFGGAPVDEEPVPPAGASQTVRVTRPDIVWIEGGAYTRGSDTRAVAEAMELCERTSPGPSPEELCFLDLFADETPEQRVWVSAFGIDRTEVTHAAYRRCVVQGVCAPPRASDADTRVSLPTHPVAGVTFAEAATYCAWIGGRLPTEAEWERAARGNDQRRFPWGDVYSPHLANHRTRDGVRDGWDYAAPVGSYPAAASPFGVLDMAGNVWEWTADLYWPEAYASEMTVDPRGARTGADRVIRGGSWFFPAYTLRTAHRARFPEGLARFDVGFRCAYDAAPQHLLHRGQALHNTSGPPREAHARGTFPIAPSLLSSRPLRGDPS
jgi:formylglycine-generating enzyme required for sulfatase activity